MSVRRRSVRLLVPGILFGLLLPIIAFAQVPVAFQVRVIHATKQPKGIDGRLAGLAKEIQELQKTFGYTTFQLIEALRGSAPLAQPWKTAIPGSRSLEIVPTASEGGHHTFTVRFVRSNGQVLVNSQVRLKSGATVFVGKVPHQEGDIYIAISAD